MSRLDWAIDRAAGDSLNEEWIVEARAELAELRATIALDREMAKEREAIYWACESCGGAFRRLPLLPDGVDPNAGVTRCTVCVEVEALRARQAAVETAAAIAEARACGW